MAVAMLCIVTWCCLSPLGGDAFNGLARGGYYYLGDKGHHLTQVSQAIYTTSLWSQRLCFFFYITSVLLLTPGEILRKWNQRADLYTADVKK
jgi:hypothetical protein